MGPWTVRAAVVSILQARAGLQTPETLVRLGLPPQEPAKALTRRVYVIAETAPEQETPEYQSGNQIPQDVFAIPIACYALAYNSEPDGSAVEAMISELVGELQDQVLADNQWGGVCVASGLTLSAESTRPLSSGDGWQAGAALNLHIKTLG